MNYRAELNQLIIVCNNTLKRKNHPVKIIFDNTAGTGYRLYTELETNKNLCELSPRMSIKNLCNWLSGFIEGLEF